MMCVTCLFVGELIADRGVTPFFYAIGCGEVEIEHLEHEHSMITGRYVGSFYIYVSRH